MIVGMCLIALAIGLMAILMATFDTGGERLIPWIYATGAVGALSFVSGAILLIAEAIAK